MSTEAGGGDPAGAASLRELPSVDELAAHASLRGWGPERLRVRAARAALDAERAARRAGEPCHRGLAELAGAVDAWLRARLCAGPRPVINATGTVIHTNLGRAPLSEAARRHALDAAGYCDLEYDLRRGARGSRNDHAAALLATLCGAEDAVVVTNGAAAVLLVLSALCRGGEVLVSRGEAVEIGGGFRIPEVMRLSGARMVDVGTTNRTRASDYAEAVTARTRAIVRVHPSNFTVTGFVERPTTAMCSEVARRHGLLLIEDTGSGALTVPDGFDSNDPVPAEVIGDGADIVTASGDKLCGGPQSGLIAGRADLVARLRRHPLMRAVRPDKLVLAALTATLAGHLRGDARDTVPVLRMLERTGDALRHEATAWAAALRADGVPAQLEPSASAVGGGSLPGGTLPTTCVVLAGPTGRLLAALREGDPPVVARAERGLVWIDPRTVLPDQAPGLLRAVLAAWTRVHPTGAAGG